MSVAVGIAQPRSAPSPAAEVDQDEEQRGHRHAADGGGHGQGRPPRVAQVAGDELALELQSGDEEEDRQQPVGRPGAQGQVQVQRRRADAGVAQGLVAGAPRGSWPRRARRRPRRAAGRRRRSPCAAPRRSRLASVQDPRPKRRVGAVVTGAAPGRRGRFEDVADQTSRRTGRPGYRASSSRTPAERPASPRRTPSSVCTVAAARTPDTSQTASAGVQVVDGARRDRRRPARRRPRGRTAGPWWCRAGCRSPTAGCAARRRRPTRPSTSAPPAPGPRAR